jgi:predicted Zn-dependent protease
VQLPEGVYRVETAVKDGADESVELDLNRDILARMFSNDVFLLNVNGGAILFWEQATYSENPDPNGMDPYRFHVNQRFLHLRNIDYQFCQFPLSITINAGETVRKSRVDALFDTPEQVYSYIQTERNITPQAKLTFLETHLNMNPNDPVLLHTYAQAAMEAKFHGHATQYLRPFLKTRPVMIHVHRLYQDIRAARSLQQDEAMRLMYDNLLKAEPQNADLLFLRGRIGKDRIEKALYLDKVIRIDPSNPFPHHSKALLLARKGDYKAATASIDRAMNGDNPPFYAEPFFYRLHLANGDYHTIQTAAEAIVKMDPTQFEFMERVLETHSLSGQPEKMEPAIKEYSALVKKKLGSDPYQLAQQARAKIQYLNEDFTGLATSVERYGTLYFLQDYQLAVLLNARKIKAAGQLLEEIKSDDPYNYLVMWMAWLQQGKPDRASPFLKKARTLLNMRRRVDQTIAQMLEGKSRDIVKEMDNITQRPEYNRRIYTAMAILYPKQRREFLAIAQRLNTLPRFPYHFLTRTHQWLRESL